MFSMIERIMADPSLPIERVNQAFDFYKRVQDDQARKAFTAAMVAAQAEMEPVRKDGYNKQTSSKYATYEALDRAIRPIYIKHGFAPSYKTAASDKTDHVKVVLCLMHKDGFEREYEADMPADGKGAKGGDVMTKTHAFGSALSYGKRYALGGAFNLITTEKDDDGNAAGANVGPINEKQLNEIVTLADEIKADKAKFCAFLEIDSLAEIPANKFEKAKAFLNAKKRKA
jgi:hypothetical protein